MVETIVLGPSRIGATCTKDTALRKNDLLV